MIPVAPRIVNDVSYVSRINHESHFAWQVQYLVMSACYFSWQMLQCHYFVPGAAFKGDVAVSLFRGRREIIDIW